MFRGYNQGKDKLDKRQTIYQYSMYINIRSIYKKETVKKCF